MSDQKSEFTEGHIVRAYDAELDRLRTLLLEMGGLVVDQIGQAVDAFTEKDRKRTQTVVRREEDVNRYDIEAEELVLNVLAKRQPMGMDLRAIMAITRAVTDLERCGDEAKKIAKIARRRVKDDSEVIEAFSIAAGSMGALAAGLLKSAVEALDEADEEKAIQAAQADARLDAEYKTALRNIHAALISNPSLIEVAADLVIVIKALERIGDHAKNIAKYVVFIVQGKDVRHVKTKALDQEI
ncbi:MAG: phosphate signaling complex protein PhoU [Gammaproteobacteria bacterium]|nr:MAG: phosphate signaling complex protein PhoU [Gammaproteobacteria bacterium]